MERPRTWLPLFPPLPFHHLRRGATAMLAVDMQHPDARRAYGMGRKAIRTALWPSQAEMLFARHQRGM